RAGGQLLERALEQHGPCRRVLGQRLAEHHLAVQKLAESHREQRVFACLLCERDSSPRVFGGLKQSPQVPCRCRQRKMDLGCPRRLRTRRAECLELQTERRFRIAAACKLGDQRQYPCSGPTREEFGGDSLKRGPSAVRIT